MSPSQLQHRVAWRTNCRWRIKRFRPLCAILSRPSEILVKPAQRGERSRNGGGKCAGKGADSKKAVPRLHAHACPIRRMYTYIPNSTPCLELLTSLPFTVLPENPKTRGFARVCGSGAKRVGSIILFLLLSPFRVILPSMYLTIDPSKPNFSLTKPFLSTNLFRDRNSLSTTTLARYNSDLLNGSQILLVSAITLVSVIRTFSESSIKNEFTSD